MKWHSLNSDEVTEILGVVATHGLDEAEAAARLARHGANRPRTRRRRGPTVRFLAQLTQPLILVLIVAGIATLLLREWIDGGVILGVVMVNAVFGFIQEGKAEAALAALARSVAAEATVLRSGTRRRLDAAELVPGDVVLLAAGDKVPADLCLLAGKELRAVEAALTGESLPVEKRSGSLPEDTPLADRHNMAFAGTLVVGGQGAGVVVATGDATETGLIARLIGETAELTTPLTRKLGEFARRLLVAILLLALLTFAVGVLRGESAFEMFMAAVALAVGAIPEGLPAAMTVTLAIGVGRMAKRRAIIRNLPAVETLGSTTVICSDKTGTLTENAMTVRGIWAGGEAFAVTGQGYAPTGQIESHGQQTTVLGALRETLLAGVLCNDARLAHDATHWSVVGDPTEGALLVAARKAGLDEGTLNSVFPRLDELTFDSARQYMATLHEIEGARVICVKGALERLLPACIAMLDRQGHEMPLDPEPIHAAAASMAASGLRVLAIARSELQPERQLEHACMDNNLVFLGLVGMIDPPRPRAIAAVHACRAAGIRVKMITGDHPGTAIAIARQIGIADDAATALTGRELASLDDPALRQAAAEVDVFARVEPEQKLRLVQALQHNGEVVAMTGDGVNDAPALKRADIGIAMGLGGHRSRQGGCRHGAHRRQFFQHCRSGRRRARHLRQHRQVHRVDHPNECRRRPGHPRGGIRGYDTADHPATDPLDQHDHGHLVGHDAGFRAGRARHHASTAAAASGTDTRSRAASARSARRHADACWGIRPVRTGAEPRAICGASPNRCRQRLRPGGTLLSLQLPIALGPILDSWSLVQPLDMGRQRNHAGIAVDVHLCGNLQPGFPDGAHRSV